MEPHEAAATVPRTDARLAAIVEEIAARAADCANDKSVADLVRQELEHRLDQWKQEQDVPQRELVYSPRRRRRHPGQSSAQPRRFTLD